MSPVVPSSIYSQYGSDSTSAASSNSNLNQNPMSEDMKSMSTELDNEITTSIIMKNLLDYDQTPTDVVSSLSKQIREQFRDCLDVLYFNNKIMVRYASPLEFDRLDLAIRRKFFADKKRATVDWLLTFLEPMEIDTSDPKCRTILDAELRVYVSTSTFNSSSSSGKSPIWGWKI
ncbi:MAG: hypothetical protein Sylvanvirus7_20 [Sylvanvirus sp.]|uniref:Uncharacterized protein n=1 Tax=Sylvanvirus sp. TaxID=2487774 RepID=A0A3G5AHN4_9VIRU|nr:MAG: hypothetical protein Sylvanvirus7_20 [Sylvanvirus sp.]